MNESTQRSGFTCQCGEYHEFSIWVHAHWNELLTFTCPTCNAKYDILRGIAMLDKRQKKKTE